MLKSFFVIILFSLANQITFSQCIDNEKIKPGYFIGKFKKSKKYMEYDKYISSVYSFGPNGEIYQKDNKLFNDAIDIKVAAINAQKYRSVVENAIKAYSGNRFFKELRLLSVDILYPERDWVPRINKSDTIQIMYEKIKDQFIYQYTYEFKADSMSSVWFSFEVNRFGKFIPPIDCPPKSLYRPINKHFIYCKLIEIARKVQKHIDPIESIEFCYNQNNKRFYWLISQDLSDKPSGSYYFHSVLIDAANLSNIKKRTELVEEVKSIPMP